MGYDYDVPSHEELAKAFPKDVDMPELVARLADFMRGKPHGSLGQVDLTAEGSISELILDGEALDDQFASLFWFGDGGQAGIWFRDTRDPLKAPMFHLDSEGQMQLIESNLSAFLWRWANKSFDHEGSLYEFLPEVHYERLAAGEDWDEEDVELSAPDLSGELKAWVEVQPECAGVIGTPPSEFVDNGSAQAWLEQHWAEVEKAREELAQDPHALAIAGVLARYLDSQETQPRQAVDDMTDYLKGVGVEDEVFDDDMKDLLAQSMRVDHAHFRVYAAGDNMVVCRGTNLVTSNPRGDLPRLPDREIEAVKPHILALREEHAKGAKGRGLWSSASMTITPDGKVAFEPSPDHEFAIGYDDFTDADFAADQKIYPKKRLEPWLKEKIECGKSGD